MTTEERWVGVEDVAGHLGVAKDSVYRWIEGKGLPAHRVGRLFRFKLSEIDMWVQKGGGDSKSNIAKKAQTQKEKAKREERSKKGKK